MKRHQIKLGLSNRHRYEDEEVDSFSNSSNSSDNSDDEDEGSTTAISPTRLIRNQMSRFKVEDEEEEFADEFEEAGLEAFSEDEVFDNRD